MLFPLSYLSGASTDRSLVTADSTHVARGEYHGHVVTGLLGQQFYRSKLSTFIIYLF